jgi:hypothetical protein
MVFQCGYGDGGHGHSHDIETRMKNTSRASYDKTGAGGGYVAGVAAGYWPKPTALFLKRVLINHK